VVQQQVIVEAVTGRPLEIFEGVKGYASPDDENDGNEEDEKAKGDGGDKTTTTTTGMVTAMNTEDLESDRSFWKAMGKKHEGQRTAMNLLRCLCVVLWCKCTLPLTNEPPFRWPVRCLVVQCTCVHVYYMWYSYFSVNQRVVVLRVCLCH
jgi:hypothetical protein